MSALALARLPVATLVSVLLGLAAGSVRAQASPPVDATPRVESPRAADPTLAAALALAPIEPAEVLDVSSGSPLELADVVRSVVLHHPPLEALQDRVDSAEGALLAAEGGFDPTLTARGSASALGYYQYGRFDVSVQQPTPFYGASFLAGWRIGRGFNRDIPDYCRYDETLDGGEARLGVTLPLLRDGWIDARRAGMWRAEHAVTAAEGERDGRTLRVVLAASEAYYRWVGAGLRYEVVHRLLALAEERDDQIGQRVAAGAVAPIERLENRRVILERHAALVTARRALERAAIQLSLYLRSDDGAPRIVPASRVPSQLATPLTVEASEAEAIETALAQRPELARIRAQREAARISQELAENQVLPRLDVALTGSVDLGTTDDPATASQLGQPVGEGLVTLTIPIPLRESRGRLDAARAEVSVVDRDTELLRDTIGIEVRDALSAVRAASENVVLAREGAEVAEAVRDGESARFDGGLTTLFIVNLREAAAAEARAREIDALVELATAHALYDAATARTIAR